MKKRQYTWSAVLFLLFMFGMFIYILMDAKSIGSSILSDYNANKSDNPTVFETLALVIDAGETAISESADRGHSFIELFGGVQRLLGKRIIQDANPDNIVVRLENGQLQFVIQEGQEQDMTPLADNLIALDDACRAAQVPMMYICAPSKVQRGAEGLPQITAEFGNVQSTALMERLEAAGVSYLDLREAFEAQEDYSGYFFDTDHHWKPEGAFFGVSVLCDLLREDYGMEIDEAVTDPEAYITTVYSRFFLGSQGKRVGTLYGGVDDISLIVPQFETNLTYTAPAYGIDRSGPFSQSVLFLERVEEQDYFGGNPYTLYAGGDYGYAKIVNHENPQGPKILLVRDSFGCAFAPFLALACSELETVDLRHFGSSLTDYIQESQPDIVLFLYTTTTTNSPAMYEFS